MCKTRIGALLMGFCILGWTTHLFAQGANEERTKRATKLEVFQRRIGVVIVKGVSQIGVVKGEGGARVIVRAIEYLDTGSGVREAGIEFFITTNKGSHPQIDYDEIDPLVKAIEQLIMLNKSVTGLDKFEGTYTTRGNLTVSLLDLPFGEGVGAAIDGNTIGGGPVFLTKEGLSELKSFISEAKAKLDSLKKQTK